MKIAGLDWVGNLAEACVEQGKARGSASFIAPAPIAPFDDAVCREEVRPLTVRGAATSGGGEASVELYLTEDGTVIRLENANQCEPLRYACLLE